MRQRTPERNHGMDALRVSAFGMLMIYHLGMGYVSDWGWHIKSHYLTDALHIPMLWSSQWRMSLLFVISGFALATMVQTKPVFWVAKQRFATLGIPLLAGIFLWVVPQVYVELADQGALGDIGLAEFIVRYWHPLLDLPDGYGRLRPTTWTWNHLWYLPYVLSYCGIYLIGIFAMGQLRARFAHSLALPAVPARFAVALLLIAPCIGYWLIGECLYQRFPTTHAFYNDWFNHASYFWSFLIGAMLAHTPTLLRRLACYWLPTLALASVTFLLVILLYRSLALSQLNAQLQGFIWSSNRWLWQLAGLALAMRFFAQPLAWVAFCKPRVFCYYLLHQTLFVVAIFGLTPRQLGPGEPIGVFLITLACCELSYLGAKRHRYTSRLLGIQAP